MIEAVASNVDYSQHWNSNFLPSGRNTGEKPVDLLVVGSVEDKFI